MTTPSSPPATAGRKRKPLLVKPANLGDMIDEERYKPIEWPMVKRLLSTLGPYRNQYLFGLALGLIHVSCDMTGPRFIQHVIDFVQKGHRAWFAPKNVGPIAYLTFVIIVWAMVAVVSFVLQRDDPGDDPRGRERAVPSPPAAACDLQDCR
jgi:hypothetical protein